jgi:hypothetical protein
VREVEAITAAPKPESPAPTAYLMEAICDPDNIEAALAAVVRNKGAACVFRRKPAGDSDAFQPVIPTEASQ